VCVCVSVSNCVRLFCIRSLCVFVLGGCRNSTSGVCIVNASIELLEQTTLLISVFGVVVVVVAMYVSVERMGASVCEACLN